MGLLDPQLEAFLAIATRHTVHAAADALHITQTAVTHRIKALETKLNVTLFLRSHRGMELSQEGKTLLHYCLASKDLEKDTLARMYGGYSEEHITISITGPTSVMQARIIPTCISLMKNNPSILFHFDISDDTSHRLEAIKNSIFHFGIVQTEYEKIPQNMASKILSPEFFVLTCSKKWIQRKTKEIIRNEKMIDFDPSDYITFNYLKQFGLFKFAQSERLFANNTEAVAAMTTAGCGYSVLTTEFGEQYKKRGTLIVINPRNKYKNSLSLVWYPRTKLPSYLQVVIDAID